MSVIYLVDPMGVLAGPIELTTVPGLGVQLPGNALVLEELLPLPETGHRWVIAGGRVQQVADHRGKVYRTDNGAEQQYAELGQLPEGLTKTPRPSPSYCWHNGTWVKDLSHAYQEKVLAINNGCSNSITAGFTSSALGAPHSYSSQLDDQLNLTGSVLRGLDMPYACRDERGVKEFRLHTTEQLRQVGDDFTLYKLQLLQHANALKQQLDVALDAGDLAALEAISWEAPQP